MKCQAKNEQTTHKSATPKKGKKFTKNGENHHDKCLQLMRLIVCVSVWLPKVK